MLIRACVRVCVCGCLCLGLSLTSRCAQASTCRWSLGCACGLGPWDPAPHLRTHLTTASAICGAATPVEPAFDDGDQRQCPPAARSRAWECDRPGEAKAQGSVAAVLRRCDFFRHVSHVGHGTGNSTIGPVMCVCVRVGVGSHLCEQGTVRPAAHRTFPRPSDTTCQPTPHVVCPRPPCPCSAHWRQAQAPRGTGRAGARPSCCCGGPYTAWVSAVAVAVAVCAGVQSSHCRNDATGRRAIAGPCRPCPACPRRPCQRSPRQ